jgi:hypothetical protein
MTYEITATVKGTDNILITSTKYFNQWLKAKAWAVEQGFTNIVMHKFPF